MEVESRRSPRTLEERLRFARDYLVHVREAYREAELAVQLAFKQPQELWEVVLDYKLVVTTRLINALNTVEALEKAIADEA